MDLTDEGTSSLVPRSIFWLLALWVVLTLLALVWGVDNAETTLRDAARRSLDADGHAVAVDFSGRDARLIGAAESEAAAQEIVDSIDSLPGVREVDSEIVVASVATPIRSPEVEVRLIGDAVSVRGLVPTSKVQADLIEAAEAQFGSGSVVNAIVVADDVESLPWLGRIQDVFSQLGELRSGGFIADQRGLVITGEVISEAALESTIAEIELLLSDVLPVTVRLTIAELPPPTFAAAGGSGAVTLSGLLPDRRAIEEVLAAAQRHHGNAVVINRMRVAEVAGPMWLESIDGLLDIVTRLDPWTIDIAEGRLVISGLGLDQDLVTAVDLLAAEVVAGQLTIVTEVEVDPAAVATQLTNLLEGNATFEPNGTELSSEGIALLDSAIAILNANPSTVLIVEGHTDDQGDPAENLELSQQRADAVVAYLVAGGIEPERLTAIGYGEERPIADNSTEVGRAQNRRIEFVIEEGDG